MKKFLLGAFISAFLFACSNEKKEDKSATTDATAATVSSTDKKNADELLSVSEGDGIKNAMDAFSKADIDGMTASYDDNIRYYWSGGDSLIGKQAVKDYYNGRWKLIDSLNISDQIVLAVKVNNPQAAAQAPGKWVLHWGMIHVKYKNGKKLNFWIHNDYHYNEAGKVDIAVQYIDKHPIMEATKGMK